MKIRDMYMKHAELWDEHNLSEFDDVEVRLGFS